MIKASGNTVPVSSGTEITTQVEQAAMPSQQAPQAQQGDVSSFRAGVQRLQATQQQQQ